MEPAAFLGLGALLLILWLATMRFYEGMWLPPASLFAVGFFLHGFAAPYVYLDIAVLKLDDVIQIIPLTTISYAAAIVGYCASFGLTRFRRQVSTIGLTGAFGIRTIRAVTVALLVYLTLYIIFTGQIYQAKGVGAYKTDVSLAERIAKVTLLIPALMGAWLINISQKRRLRIQTTDMTSWVLCLVWLFVISAILFARREALTALLIAMLYLWYRTAAFSCKGSRLFILGLTAIVVLQVAASFRVYGTGISDLTLREVSEHIRDVVLEDPVVFFFYGIMSSLPGQDVFVEVVKMVPSSYPYQYGYTYVHSLVGLLLPRFLGLSSYDDPRLPSRWFRDTYAPETEDHGFDFSMLAEAYLNFGSGMFAVFIIVGAIVGKASVGVRRSKGTTSVLLAILTIVGLTFGVRSDSNTLLKSVAYPYIAILLIREVERRMLTVVAAGRERRGILGERRAPG